MTLQFPARHSADVMDIMEAAVIIRKMKREEWTDENQVTIGRLLRKTKEKWIHAWEIAQCWDVLQDPTNEETNKEHYRLFLAKVDEKGFRGKFGKTPWDMKPMFSC
mmetsp:Transcript_4835/g.5886  ORF Transcript_4835/g.5886 Transcript_4835/m.5886 type:complete len:106 (-) Transcript_4835:302-619(-)